MRALTSDHEDLDGINNKDIVNMETRMSVIEREESVDGQLCAKVIVFPT